MPGDSLTIQDLLRAWRLLGDPPRPSSPSPAPQEVPVLTPPDNVSAELLDLARAGDYQAFREMASLVMRPELVEECYRGTRRRLDLDPGPPAQRARITSVAPMFDLPREPSPYDSLVETALRERARIADAFCRLHLSHGRGSIVHEVSTNHDEWRCSCGAMLRQLVPAWRRDESGNYTFDHGTLFVASWQRTFYGLDIHSA